MDIFHYYYFEMHYRVTVQNGYKSIGRNGNKQQSRLFAEKKLNLQCVQRFNFLRRVDTKKLQVGMKSFL